MTPGIDLSSIDMSSVDPVTLAMIDELISIEAANPQAVYWSGGMSQGQRAFHGDQHPNRLIRAANKVGKTSALSNETWGFGLGIHPYNDYWGVPEKCVILYVVADLEASYADDVCANLREYEPPGALDPACTYDPVRGYMVHGKRGILTSNGSRVIFRSGKQDGMSLEGIWAHVVMINEPPKKNRWGGIMRAAAKTNAPIIMAFTSVGDDLTWLRHIVEEHPKTKHLWGQTVITLSLENAPWRTQEDIEAQIANCASWEVDQRIYASWDGTHTERSYDGFGPQSISTELPDVDVDIVLGIDHGERPGNEAAVIIATWKEPYTKDPHAYIMGEYVSPGRTTPEQDAMNIERILDGLGISLFNVSSAIGDVNSAGKSAGGESVNRMMERAFADLAKMPSHRPPFGIKKTRKRPGSVLGGLKIINAALNAGRLKVHPRCTETIKCYRQWKGGKSGDDGDYTHLLDAVRYAVSDHLDTGKRRGVVEILV